MIHLFLRLFLLIVVSFLLFNYFGLNPVNYLRKQQSENYVTQQLKGVQYHLLDTLQPLTPEQRQQWIRQHNKHFHYRLKLGNANDFPLTTRQQTQLKNTQAVFQFGPPSWFYIPFPDEPQILRMQIHESIAESYALSARGIIWLMQQKIAPYPDIHEGLRSIQAFFTYPVQAIKAEQLELSAEQWHQLREDDLIVVNAPESANAYLIYAQYQTPQHGAWIIRAGPIDESTTLNNVILLGMLGTTFMLLVPILLWLLWFWFDLRKFQRTSQQYGNGKLDTRLQLTKGSALYLPGQSFNQMANNLQKLIEGHKTLVNAVSHELKTPIARLSFALEMLRDATDDDEKNHSHTVIQQNIQELETQIQELLLYARYERPITPVKLEQATARQWLDSICQRFHTDYPALTLRIETEGLQHLHMDQRAMRHLINNLLDNAAEHCRNEVLLQLNADRTHCKITVEDDGPGVAEKWRETIFEPFSRPDSSRQRETGGRGLGLAIVRQIARQHGGEVYCRSGEVLPGAQFTVTYACATTNAEHDVSPTG